MTQLQTTMLALIRQALTGEGASLPEPVDWVAIFKLAKSHKLLPLLCETISQYSTIPKEIREKTREYMYKELYVSENQRKEIETLRQTFLAKSFDFILLKGAELKDFYPQHYMRPMGDADILIRMEQYPQIAEAMGALGYKEGYENEHELVWDKGFFHLELHKCLIPPYNKDFYAYFGDGWALAKPTEAESSEYHFREEDNFIYLFTHFAKHYRSGGMGILHVLDLQVYLNTKPNLDKAYIGEELKKLHLHEFYTNIQHLLTVWFFDAETNEVTDFITDTVFGSMQYGDRQNKAVSAALRETAHVKSPRNRKLVLYLRKLFPKRKDLAEYYYPWLNKLPFLLPVGWVMHLFYVLIHKRDNIRQRQQELKMLSSERLDSRQKDLQYVGLDYFH